MRELKVVVLGSGGVGKSALTVRFVNGAFVERYDPTIEDFYRKEIRVEGSPTMLEILDTAGTEQFASMRDLYIKNGQGFVVVYSLTARQTFLDIRSLREQITRVKGTHHVPIVLVGNKLDLARGPAPGASGPQREVTRAEGEALAEQWACPFLEASARTNENVNQLFIEVVRQVEFLHNRANEKSGCRCTIL